MYRGRSVPADFGLRAALGLPFGRARLQGRLDRLVRVPPLRGATRLRSAPRLEEGRVLPRRSNGGLRGNAALHPEHERPPDDVPDLEGTRQTHGRPRSPCGGGASGPPADPARAMRVGRGGGEASVRAALRLRAHGTADRAARGESRHRLRRSGRARPADRARDRGGGDVDLRGDASAQAGRRRSNRADLVPPAGAEGRDLAPRADPRRARRHDRLLAGLGRALRLQGPVPGRGPAQRARPQGTHELPDRRDRRCCDHVAARGDRRRAQLGLPLLLAP